MKTSGIRLSSQLSAAFVLILVSYGVLLFGTIASSRGIRRSYEALFSRKDEQTRLAYTINSEMQEAQKQEREFFLSKDAGAAYNVRQYCDVVSTWAEALGSETGASGGAGPGGALIAAVAEYKTAFSRAVGAWEARGAGPQQGLQGRCGRAARELEKQIAGHPGLENGYLLLRQQEKDYLLTLEDRSVGEVQEQARAMKRRLAGELRSPAAQAAVGGLLDSYLEAFAAMAAKDAEIKEATRRVHAAGATIQPLVKEVLGRVEQNLKAEKMLVDAFSQRRTLVFVGIAVGVLLAAGVLLLLIARSILRQVGGEPAAIAAAAGKVAEGDLSVELDSGRRRQTGIAQAVSVMVGRLNGLLREVIQSAGELSDCSAELSGSAQQLAEGAQNQASQLEQTAASVEQLIASVDQVAQHAQSQTASVEENLGRIEEVKSAGSQVEANLKGAMEAIDSIAASSGRITGILGVISDIARQTNLLALNASIEAARAGEHGRGFAVVAEEVSKLAQRSSASAGEIQALIRESQTNIAAGQAMIDKLARAIQQQVETIREAAAALQDISGMSQNISAATEEQSTGAKEVSKAIEQVNEVTQAAAVAAAQVSASTTGLLSLARNLQQMVEQFRLRGEEGEEETRRLEAAPLPALHSSGSVL